MLVDAGAALADHLGMAQLIRVTARFVDKSTGSPLAGDYRVKLFDKDVVSDDLLAEASLTSEGTVELLADPRDAGEAKPDLYLVLEHAGTERHRTPVRKDVDVLARDPVTGQRRNLTVDFGTVEV